MSFIDLKREVSTGRVIRGRLIQGHDLAKVLQTYTAATRSCRTRPALRLDRSQVEGAVGIKSRESKHPGEDTDGDISDSDMQPIVSAWITIPVSLCASTIQSVVADSLGFSCRLSLDDSTVTDTFDFNNVILAGGMSAINSTFRQNVEILATRWDANTSFKRAKFLGNVEIFSGGSRITRFSSDVDFQEAVFHRFANFIGTHFDGRMNMRYAQFQGEANFGSARIGLGPARSFAGPFYGTEFQNRANFRTAHFTSLTFTKTIFRNGMEFSNAHGTLLLLRRVTVNGRTDFSDAKIHTVSFEGPIVLEDNAVFRRAQFEKTTLFRIFFRKAADFEATDFADQFELRNVSFEGDVHWEDATFPGMNGPCTIDSFPNERPRFVISDTTFSGGLYVNADHLLCRQPDWAIWKEELPRFFAGNSLKNPDPAGTISTGDRAANGRLWRELEHAFHASNDLRLENYAAYRLRREEEEEKSGLSFFTSALSRWFWGYGVRPLRVLGWLAVIFIAFSAIYLTQISYVAANLRFLPRLLTRLGAASIFSARTIWELKFGYEQSTTRLFQFITVTESFLGKALMACFAYSLSHTSPLLNELLKKILP